MRRRAVLQGLAGGALSAIGGRAAAAPPAAARVLVVGGGFGGATAAKYIRLLSAGAVEVVLIEPGRAFVSCPVSNLVVAGQRRLSELTTTYDGLRTRHGVSIVQDTVTAIDAATKTVGLAGADALRYDRLIVSPGADLMFDEVEGLAAARAEGRIVQAWKAGPETETLWHQLQAMRDGGTFVITVPEAPYRCPPGPYERACVVAAYLKANKPRSKVLVLDANPDIVSKATLFRKAWADLYPGMVEYRPLFKATSVDARAMTVGSELGEDVHADVLNVLPPMRAGDILMRAGLADARTRWAPVDYRTFASTVARDIHVLGDSTQPAPAMPKSAHMANGHGKVAAAAIVAELGGLESDPEPLLTNTCYSFVSFSQAIHVASVHAYVGAERTFRIVPGSGGVSAVRSEAEADYARGWARNIWSDSFG